LATWRRLRTRDEPLEFAPTSKHLATGLAHGLALKTQWRTVPKSGTVSYMLHPSRRWVVQLCFALSTAVPLLSGTALAEPPAAAPDLPTAERYSTAENLLHDKLLIWQKRLKLQDWNLTVKMVRPTDLKPKTLGNIHWDAESHTATIKVLDIADYKLTFEEALKDQEFTVVHELLHLQLSSLPRNEASRSVEEKAVNALTEALLDLDRR
jgi:hypothetical protein